MTAKTPTAECCGENIEIRFVCEPCATCPEDEPIYVDMSAGAWCLNEYNYHNSPGNQPVTESAEVCLDVSDGKCAREEKRKLNIIFQRAHDNAWLKQGGRCYVEMREPDVDGDNWWSARLLPDTRNCLTSEAGRMRPRRYDSDDKVCLKPFTVSFRRENCWVQRGVTFIMNWGEGDDDVYVEGWIDPNSPIDINNTVDASDEGNGVLNQGDDTPVDGTAEDALTGNDCPPVIGWSFRNDSGVPISKIWMYQRCGDCSPFTPSQFTSATVGPNGFDPTYVTSIDTNNVDEICVEWNQDALNADPNNPTNSIRPICFPINLWDLDICTQRTYRPVINICNLDEFEPGELKVKATWTYDDLQQSTAPLGDSEWIYIEDMDCSWQELGTITFPEYCIPDLLTAPNITPNGSGNPYFTNDGLCLEFCSTTGGDKKVIFEFVQFMPVFGWRQYAAAGVGGRNLEPGFWLHDYPDKNYTYQQDTNLLQEFNFTATGEPLRLCPGVNNRFYFLMADENGKFLTDYGMTMAVIAFYSPTKRCL